MTRFVVEKYFRYIFMAFSVYFLSIIETLGWNWLIYTPTFCNIFDLVKDILQSLISRMIASHSNSNGEVKFTLCTSEPFLQSLIYSFAMEI